MQLVFCLLNVQSRPLIKISAYFIHWKLSEDLVARFETRREESRIRWRRVAGRDRKRHGIRTGQHRVRPQSDHDGLVGVKHPRDVLDPNEVDRYGVGVDEEPGEDEQRKEGHSDQAHGGVDVGRHDGQERAEPDRGVGRHDHYERDREVGLHARVDVREPVRRCQRDRRKEHMFGKLRKSGLSIDFIYWCD